MILCLTHLQGVDERDESLVQIGAGSAQCARPDLAHAVSGGADLCAALIPADEDEFWLVSSSTFFKLVHVSPVSYQERCIDCT